MIPLKTAAIEFAHRKGDHQVGNLHVNCQHLVIIIIIIIIIAKNKVTLS